MTDPITLVSLFLTWGGAVLHIGPVLFWFLFGFLIDILIYVTTVLINPRDWPGLTGNHIFLVLVGSFLGPLWLPFGTLVLLILYYENCGKGDFFMNKPICKCKRKT